MGKERQCGDICTACLIAGTSQAPLGKGESTREAAHLLSAILPAHWDCACSQQGAEEEMGPEKMCSDVKGAHTFP